MSKLNNISNLNNDLMHKPFIQVILGIHNDHFYHFGYFVYFGQIGHIGIIQVIFNSLVKLDIFKLYQPSIQVILGMF